MLNFQKLPIKVNDNVTVISGSYKGEKGQVLKINKKTGKIIVKNLNLRFKHLKSKTRKGQGKIVRFEAPIHHSNVKKS